MEKFAKKYPKTHKFLTTAGHVANIAMKAYGMATTIASLVNAEKKYYDTTIANTNVDGTLFNLSNLAGGSTETTRNGNSILCKSIQGKALFTWNSEGSPVQRIRVIVFRDANNLHGVAPAIGDVLEYTGAPQIISPLNMDNAKRFHIIRDKLLLLSDQLPAAKIKFYTKFPMLKDKKGNRTKGIHATYYDDTQGHYEAGQIWMVAFTDAPAEHLPAYEALTRLRFYDN